MNVVATGP